MESGTGDPVLCSQVQVSQVALIAALELEARIPRRIDGAGGAVVYTSGPGQQRSLAAGRSAVAAGARALISWGLAGGLTPDCDTGTVVLPATIMSDAGEWRTDDAWRAELMGALRSGWTVTEQPLYTAERVLTSPAAKAGLAARTGAVAVDMESAGVAQAAAEARLPFVVLRVIADGPGDALPELVEALVTDDGKTRYPGLAGFVTSPGDIRLLAGLARNSGRARRVLKQVFTHLLESR